MLARDFISNGKRARQQRDRERECVFVLEVNSSRERKREMASAIKLTVREKHIVLM